MCVLCQMAKVRIKRAAKPKLVIAAKGKYKLTKSSLQKVSIKLQQPTSAHGFAGHSSTTIIQPTAPPPSGLAPTTSGVRDDNSSRFDALIAALARIEAQGVNTRAGSMVQLPTDYAERFMNYVPRDGRDGIDGRDGLPGAQGPIGPQGNQGAQGIPGVPGVGGQEGPRGESGRDGNNMDINGLVSMLQTQANRAQAPLTVPNTNTVTPLQLPIQVPRDMFAPVLPSTLSQALTLAGQPMEVDSTELALRESTRRAAEGQLTERPSQHRRTGAMTNVPLIGHQRTTAGVPELTDGTEQQQIVPRADRSMVSFPDDDL
jgi:hypothetical protein